MRKWFGGFRRKSSDLHRNQRGAEAIEYLVVTAMVIITTAAAWRFLGSKITQALNRINAAIEESTTGGGFSF